MAILRETRAKIDPDLLARMREKISAAGLAGKPAPAKTDSKESVFSAELVEAMSKKKQAPPAAQPKTSANNAAATYAATAAPATPAKQDPSKPEMVPVDRQKIAAIVMEYMRLREEKKPGH